MTKTELFNLIIGEVVKVCEVSIEEVMAGGRKQTVCDARCITVKVCRKYGLTTADLLQITGRKNPNNINSLIVSYANRFDQSFFFRQAVADVINRVKELLKNVEETKD